MRSHSRIIATVTTLALIVLALAPRAEAGQRWERMKRSPLTLGLAGGVGGAMLATHPLTGPLILGTGKVAGAVLGGAANLTGGLMIGGGNALLAAAAVSPLGALVFGGATIYAGVQGWKFVARKIRERREGGGLGAAPGGGLSSLRERFDRSSMAPGMAPAPAF